MVKIDLITGFLGSGKTTFIKKYAKYFIDSGNNIGILENDHGAVNVDMMLLGELEGENCELEMVSGGCDADCYRRRFKTKLIAMGMCGYDRVIVEPSGVFDVDEFFDLLREEPLDNWYEIGNVITIADALLEDNLSDSAEYLLASEAADAGVIVLSHADMATERDIERTIDHLNRAFEKISCERRAVYNGEVSPESVPVIKASLNELREDELGQIAGCGYVLSSFCKRYTQKDSGFESLYYMNTGMDEAAARRFVDDIFNDAPCGDIFRIKGFVKNADGSWHQLNATKSIVTSETIANGQDVIIVIGQRLDKSRIDTLYYSISNF